MIALDVEPLAAEQAARRAAVGRNAFWIASPGPHGDIEIVSDMIGCDPVRAVRGEALEELAAAWTEQRRRWVSPGEAAPAGVPLAAGFFSYDLGRRWIRLPARARDDHGWPDLQFYFYDAVFILDGARGKATIFAQDLAAARRLEARLAMPSGPDIAPPTLGALRPDENDSLYLEGAARILDYLRAGDAYQVNLARRLSATLAPQPSSGDPLWLAAALRANAPAPHAFYLSCDAGGGNAGGGNAGRYLVGNSPERFLALDGQGHIETRPIKGTRARAADPQRDEAARAELCAASKERAEHVMIVDLERNDLGRVCRPGSIAVEGLARVMALPTVFHLVSTVSGRLRPEVDFVALLRATFPGGSITGAPKQRAMEIIEELEPVRRGPYTGATGWLGVAGDLDLAVAIRTAVIAGGRMTLSVGGGIVADSRPDAELAETEAKARAFTALCAG